MKTTTAFFAAAAALAAATIATSPRAQPSPPAYDEPREYRDRSDEFREAFRRGYMRGYENGYSQGFAEGQQRSAAVVPPPVPLVGPIRIRSAYYGTSSRNCDASRFLASRANGRRSFSMDVTNNICGDPAKGQRKSLEVAYSCGDLSKTASANEHRSIYLDCGS